jgi:hypothetical protein
MNKNEGYEFWTRIDAVNPYKTLSELVRKAGLNYGSTKTQRTNNRIPAAFSVYKLAVAVEASVEYLLTGKIEQKKSYPIRIEVIADKLCKVSDQNLSLIENTINLMPIEDKSIKVNVVS